MESYGPYLAVSLHQSYLNIDNVLQRFVCIVTINYYFGNWDGKFGWVEFVLW